MSYLWYNHNAQAPLSRARRHETSLSSNVACLPENLPAVLILLANLEHLSDPDSIDSEPVSRDRGRPVLE